MLDVLVDAIELDVDTVTQITGRGGQHHFLSYDPALHVPSVPLTPRGFPAIEMKADGGRWLSSRPFTPRAAVPYAFEDAVGPGEIEVASGAGEIPQARRSIRSHDVPPLEEMAPARGEGSRRSRCPQCRMSPAS